MPVVPSATDLSPRAPSRDVAGPLGAVVAALALLAVATYPVRDVLFTAVAGAAARSPLGGVAAFVPDAGLLLLVAAAAVLAVRTLRGDRRRFVMLAAGGVGVVAAYATSELLKLVVTEERPCRALDVTTVLACPPPGDWSWPSNHSTVAAAFATALVLVVPRAWPTAAAVALAVAAGRVAGGVHYVHDTFSGLALGVACTAAVGLAVLALASRVPPVARFAVSRDGEPLDEASVRDVPPQASIDGSPVTGGSADQGNVIHRSVSRQE